MPIPYGTVISNFEVPGSFIIYQTSIFNIRAWKYDFDSGLFTSCTVLFDPINHPGCEAFDSFFYRQFLVNLPGSNFFVVEPPETEFGY